jgi:rhodanese-related sulfurtransferase
MLLTAGMVAGLLIFFSQDRLLFHDLFTTEIEQGPSLASPRPVIENLDLGTLLPLYHKKEITFVDLRQKQYYDYGHIEGAINIPTDSVSQIPPALLESLKKERNVVLYNVQDYAMTRQAAEDLAAKGIRSVAIYADGWPQWWSSGLPVTMK